MNHIPNQSTSSQQGKPKRPSLQTDVEQSDSKEILFLAAGLITLTLGLGGLFMYSADEPLPITASQEATEEVSTFQMAKAFATPTPSSTTRISKESSSPSATESSLHLINNSPATSGAEDTDIYFEFNRWALSAEAKNLIKTKVDAQVAGWTGILHIDGHTDAQGPDAYNQALGLKRAEAVRTYLISLGISEARITIQSFGKDGAICQEQTPDCFERNRRAHVAFLNQPDLQQDTTLLSMPSDVVEDSTLETSSPIINSPSIDASENKIVSQEEIPVELVVVESVASADSLP